MESWLGTQNYFLYSASSSNYSSLVPRQIFSEHAYWLNNNLHQWSHASTIFLRRKKNLILVMISWWNQILTDRTFQILFVQKIKPNSLHSLRSFESSTCVPRFVWAQGIMSLNNEYIYLMRKTEQNWNVIAIF